jgi:hypothetical protein
MEEKTVKKYLNLCGKRYDRYLREKLYIKIL